MRFTLGFSAGWFASRTFSSCLLVMVNHHQGALTATASPAHERYKQPHQRRRGNMDIRDAYDPSKIEIPKTNAEFWLALLRVRNQYLAEAGRQHAKIFATTGEFDDNHVWHTWLYLDYWLDKAFAEWRLSK
jgi:hypothetical protein